MQGGCLGGVQTHSHQLPGTQPRSKDTEAATQKPPRSRLALTPVLHTHSHTHTHTHAHTRILFHAYTLICTHSYMHSQPCTLPHTNTLGVLVCGKFNVGCRVASAPKELSACHSDYSTEAVTSHLSCSLRAQGHSPFIHSLTHSLIHWRASLLGLGLSAREMER